MPRARHAAPSSIPSDRGSRWPVRFSAAARGRWGGRGESTRWRAVASRAHDRGGCQRKDDNGRGVEPQPLAYRLPHPCEQQQRRGGLGDANCERVDQHLRACAGHVGKHRVHLFPVDAVMEDSKPTAVIRITVARAETSTEAPPPAEASKVVSRNRPWQCYTPCRRAVMTCQRGSSAYVFDTFVNRASRTSSGVRRVAVCGGAADAKVSGVMRGLPVANATNPRRRKVKPTHRRHGPAACAWRKRGSHRRA